MADAVTIKLSNDGLTPLVADLHEQIVAGDVSELTLDMAEARNFGAFDIQGLIHLDRAAASAGATVCLQGATPSQRAVLASRHSSSLIFAEPA